MLTLAEFLMRLCFGLALGMAATSPQLVSSGYFRNHLYVTLGAATLAALAISFGADGQATAAWTTVAASYMGSVFWLYEKPRAGRVALLAVAASALLAASQLSQQWLAAARMVQSTLAAPTSFGVADGVLWTLQPLTSGLLLGFTMAAMLLGHWYLNSPGMELGPLRRLLVAMMVATALHGAICGTGLVLDIVDGGVQKNVQWWLFVAMRWLFGLPSVAVLAGMAWATLRIPNTQSATGILYVAVIGTFVGETLSLLLSAESTFPL